MLAFALGNGADLLEELGFLLLILLPGVLSQGIDDKDTECLELLLLDVDLLDDDFGLSLEELLAPRASAHASEPKRTLFE